MPKPSRETKLSGANVDREIFIFSCSAGHELDCQRYPVDPYSNSMSQVLSTCPLHTNSGCGKERRILIGHGDLPKQHPFETTLRFTGPVTVDSRQ